jgi:hypothetical protein
VQRIALYLRLLARATAPVEIARKSVRAGEVTQTKKSPPNLRPLPPPRRGAKKFFEALGRFREGVYVNFLGGDEDPDRVREAYGDSIYDRLADVKFAYDPYNVFHHNQNIRPGAGTSISRTSWAQPH